jgi:plastocyanin
MLTGQLAWAGTIEGRIQIKGTNADLSNYVVYVDDIEGSFPAPKEVAVMDQKDLRFIPHVLVIQAGTSVEFPNSDPVSHNVFSISKAKRFNLGLYSRGTVRRVTFDKPGVVELLCNVHLEMAAFIVVMKNPYFDRTGPDGSFRIQNVPAGRHRLRCWQEGMPAREQIVEVPSEGTVNVVLAMGRETAQIKMRRFNSE